MDTNEEWKMICSDAVLKGDKICQIPYSLNGSYICRACYQICRQTQQKQFKQTDHYFLAFKCQCQFIENGAECIFKERCQEEYTQEDVALKVQLKEGYATEIDKLTTVDVKPNMLQQQNFSHQIEDNLEKVYLYEDELVQSIALSLIPEEIQSQTDQVKQLKALLKWFKTDFFTWCDRPLCPKCNRNDQVQMMGAVEPTLVERTEGHAGRVENFGCKRCQVQVRFPRYNHPMKLMETRTGRCGEWANCFTALCRALGHEARFVADWTDHVWTECYINEWKRWVHMDSCENAFDKPMLYEGGWGKKLNYVIGFSKDEVVDVTNRYVMNRMMNRMRRTIVPESWLQQILKVRRERMWEMQGPQRLKELQERYLNEIDDMSKSKEVKQDENVPRQSGAIEWRQQRGEIGSTQNQPQQQQQQNNQEEQKQGTCGTGQQQNARVQQVLKAQSDEEKFKNKREQEDIIKKLYIQMTIGCGKSGCQNKEHCQTGNPQFKGKDKTEVVQTVLKSTISGKYKLCHQ